MGHDFCPALTIPVVHPIEVLPFGECRASDNLPGTNVSLTGGFNVDVERLMCAPEYRIDNDPQQRTSQFERTIIDEAPTAVLDNIVALTSANDVAACSPLPLRSDDS